MESQGKVREWKKIIWLATLYFGTQILPPIFTREWESWRLLCAFSRSRSLRLLYHTGSLFRFITDCFRYTGTRPSDVNKEDMNYCVFRFYIAILDRKWIEKVSKARRTPGSELVDQNLAPAILFTLRLYVLYEGYSLLKTRI